MEDGERRMEDGERRTEDEDGRKGLGMTNYLSPNAIPEREAR